MERKRIFYLDFIRVFALFCIIWCHTNNVEFDSYLLEKVKWFFGKCGVPLFFLVSGYLAFPMNKPLDQYAKSKLRRVFFPFVVWVLLYAIIEYIQGKPVCINGDILNEGSAHLWFIYVIIELYLIVPIIDPFLRIVKKNVLRCYLILWICTGMFPLLQHIFSSPFNEHIWMYTLYHFYGYIGYFVLGYYFKTYGDQTRLLNLKASFAFIFASILLMSSYLFIFDCTTVLTSDYKGLPIILYSIATFAILKKIAIYIEHLRLSKYIVSLSIYSFGIYLIHMLVVMFIYPIIPQFDVLPDLLTTAILVLINVGISYMVVYLLSKIRYSYYIFG